MSDVDGVLAAAAVGGDVYDGAVAVGMSDTGYLDLFHQHVFENSGDDVDDGLYHCFGFVVESFAANVDAGGVVDCDGWWEFVADDVGEQNVELVVAFRERGALLAVAAFR